MKATKPQYPTINQPEPARAIVVRVYRGRPVVPMTVAEIAWHCRVMAWEIDPDAPSIH
jgi:hypothetical protein